MKKGIDFFLAELVERYPGLRPCVPDMERAYRQMISCYLKNGKILIMGNGGSAADADHITGELMKGFLKKRPLSEEVKEMLRDCDEELGGRLAAHLQKGLPALALTTHSALLTAFSNDVEPEMIFAQQIMALAGSSDLVMGLSTSGNSINVLMGICAAKAIGLSTLGLTGGTGGRLGQLCDVTVCVPEQSTPLVQEYHLPVYHALCAAVEDYFFDE